MDVERDGFCKPDSSSRKRRLRLKKNCKERYYKQVLQNCKERYTHVKYVKLITFVINNVCSLICDMYLSDTI